MRLSWWFLAGDNSLPSWFSIEERGRNEKGRVASLESAITFNYLPWFKYMILLEWFLVIEMLNGLLRRSFKMCVMVKYLYPRNANISISISLRKATKYWDSKVKANIVDPDQTAPAGAVWSGSTLPIPVHYCICKTKLHWKKNCFIFRAIMVFFWCPRFF